MLNLTDDTSARKSFIIKSDNYFNEYELTQSLFLKNLKTFLYIKTYILIFVNLKIFRNVKRIICLKKRNLS